MKNVKKMFGALYHLDDCIAGVSLVILVGAAILGVFFRYVLSAPLKWVEEVSLMCVVWFVFVGGSSATKRNSHVGIDFVIALFPVFIRKAAFVVVHIVIFSVLGFMTYWGYLLALQAGYKVTDILRISYTYIDLAVPVGCVMMMIQFALQMKSTWRKEFEGADK